MSAPVQMEQKCNGNTREWWKECVTYQVYPRTYKDSNHDGIGDINGLIEKIPYIASLNVGCVWLSPVYKSPQDDNGYDISDYITIDKLFGTNEDIEKLIKEMHKNNIKLCMDLVVNHTSSEHEWFKASRDPSHPYHEKYRDFYIWRKQPNNWESYFSGSTWEYEAKRGEYYLHLFAVSQPDLNWENPNVRNEVYKLMQFWLDHGVDGFRMDVINLISKVEGFPDNIDKNQKAAGKKYIFGTTHFVNGPRIHEFLREMNSKVLTLEKNFNPVRGSGKGTLIAIGETVDVTTNDGLKYTGENRKELGLLFQFEHQMADCRSNDKWDLEPALYDKELLVKNDVHPYFYKYKSILSNWQMKLFDPKYINEYGFGWNSLYQQNHDQPRIVSRYGHDETEELRSLSAKSLALMLHCLRGTPFIYQGEELGMTNVKFTTIDEIQDIETRNMYFDYVNNYHFTPERVLDMINYRSREHSRTVMQWDTSNDFAGFSDVAPDPKILCTVVNKNYKEGLNVENENADSNSVLNFYRKLTDLRSFNPKTELKKQIKDLIVYGDFIEVIPENKSVYAYWRKIDGYERKLLAIASLNKNPKGLDIKIPILQNIDTNHLEILLNNYNKKVNEMGNSIKINADMIDIHLDKCEAMLLMF